MKYLVFIILIVLTSCSSNPEELAKEYCRCRAAIDKKEKTEQDCQDLAESHFMRLQDNEEALTTYSGKVVECLGNAEIKTEK